VTAKAPGAFCSSRPATCAACGPAAPIGTSRGFVLAAGSANAIAMIASTTVRPTTMPVARSAAGGRWRTAGWSVWRGGDWVSMVALSSVVELTVCASLSRPGNDFNSH
jgi:hypothetical protein